MLSVSILKNGKNIFSISEERLNRIKAYCGFPYLSVDYIFENKIVSIKEVVCIATNSFSFFYSPVDYDKSYYDLLKKYYKKHNKIFPEKLKNFIQKDYHSIENFIRSIFEFYGCKDFQIENHDHHLSHASSAYYGSGFDDCLVVSSDGLGDNSLSGLVIEAKNNIFTPLDSTTWTGSLGHIYSSVTTLLGYKAARHEGKITGLAAYGNPNKIYNELKK